MPAQTKDVSDPPPLATVGPGGPQPGHNQNWSYQMSQALSQIAASQSYGAVAPPDSVVPASLFPYQ